MDNRVVNLDGKVYSLGGGDGSASTTKNYAYDPAAQSLDGDRRPSRRA